MDGQHCSHSVNSTPNASSTDNVLHILLHRGSHFFRSRPLCNDLSVTAENVIEENRKYFNVNWTID